MAGDTGLAGVSCTPWAHIVDVSPFVQIRCNCAAHGEPTGGSLEDARHCGAVPKISCPPRPLRAVLSEPQMAEQLVDVHTVVSPILQFVEQNADIPVPGARGVLGHGGLHGFLPEQSSRPCLPSRPSTLQFEGVGVQVVEVFKVFTQDRVRCSVLSSRSLTFQLQVASFKIFLQMLVWQLLPMVCLESCSKMFSHIPRLKNVRRVRGVRVRGCTRTRAHPGSSSR